MFSHLGWRDAWCSRINMPDAASWMTRPATVPPPSEPGGGQPVAANRSRPLLKYCYKVRLRSTRRARVGRPPIVLTMSSCTMMFHRQLEGVAVRLGFEVTRRLSVEQETDPRPAHQGLPRKRFDR